MAATQLSSKDIGSVQRNDFDITTTGQAVITKIIAGTNITISQTGVDNGTGDVTINAVSGGGGDITPIANSGANSLYPSGAYAFNTTTTDGYLVDGRLTGTRNGTLNVQRLQSWTTGSTYARYWLEGTTSWTGWNLYIDTDTNGNSSINNLLEGYSTTATATGTTTLTAASTYVQYFTGTLTQIVKLPAANTLTLGQEFVIVNRSTGALTLQNNASTVLLTLSPNSTTYVQVTNIGTLAGAWDTQFLGNETPSGTNATYTFSGTSGTVIDNNTLKIVPLPSDAPTNTTVTLATISGLSTTVGVGTYKFEYLIRYQSAATTTGIKLAIDHSGTASYFAYTAMAQDSVSANSSGNLSQNMVSGVGGVVIGLSARAKNTTLTFGGVDTINADMLMIVTGHCIITGTGTLSLLTASEVAASGITTKAGSSLILTKLA